MKLITIKKGFLSVFILLVLILATACASKTSNNSSSSGENTVKVAAIAPLSGPFAKNGQDVLRGTEFAIEEINANGGIKSLGGKKFELIKADAGSSDPSQAVSVTRRVLQQNPDLTAIVGEWLSSYTVAASTVTEKEKVLMLTQSYTDEITDRGLKYVFQYPSKASEVGSASVEDMIKIAKEENYKLDNVAIVADNSSAIKTVAESLAVKFKAKGIDVSVKEYYQPGITDATTISTKIAEAKPDLVFIGGALPDVSLVMKSTRGMGYQGPFLGSGGAYILPDFIKATGSAGNGAFSTTVWNADLPYPGVKEFNKKYMAKYDVPFAPQDAGTSYAMMYTLKQALENAGTTDREKVRNAFAEIDIDSIMTGGHIRFDENGMNKDVHPLLVEWIDGELRSVYPKEVQTVEPIFKISK